MNYSFFFFKREESRSGSNRGPSASKLSVLPLGHIGPLSELLQVLFLKASSRSELRAMEMRCYSKILRISYKCHVTNEEVCAKTQQAIEPHEGLLTIVKRRRLKWYGHVSRSSGLAKIILQAQLKGEEDKADRYRDGKTTSRE